MEGGWRALCCKDRGKRWTPNIVQSLSLYVAEPWMEELTFLEEGPCPHPPSILQEPQTRGREVPARLSRCCVGLGFSDGVRLVTIWIRLSERGSFRRSGGPKCPNPQEVKCVVVHCLLSWRLGG